MASNSFLSIFFKVSSTKSTTAWVSFPSTDSPSAASAIYDHIYVLENGSNDIEALGIMSNGEYDIRPDLMFSLPLRICDGAYKVEENIKINESLIDLIKITEEELVQERDIVKQYLP